VHIRWGSGGIAPRANEIAMLADWAVRYATPPQDLFLVGDFNISSLKTDVREMTCACENFRDGIERLWPPNPLRIRCAAGQQWWRTMAQSCATATTNALNCGKYGRHDCC
jgi:hypothetical protein